MSVVLEARNLVLGYGNIVVARVDFLQIVAGRLAVVTGPNGSGKTTLLKTLAGLLRPAGGRLSPGMSGGAGGAVFIHSHPFLFAGTVRRNVLAAPGATEEEARRALRALSVEGLWDSDVTTLSSGQRQRIALARGLAARPRLLLVDEPEGGLDAEAIAAWRLIVRQALHDGSPAVVIAAPRVEGLEDLPADFLELGGPANVI